MVRLLNFIPKSGKGVNAMRIKALKEKVTATATLLLFSPKTVFANEIQNAINSSNSSSFDNLENFFQRIIDMTEGWIGYFGAFAFITGILIWLATSFSKKYRGMGLACVLTALAALVVWLLLPALVSSLSG